VISRKAQVVRAVETGRLSEAEACARYDLTPEELDGWRQLISRHGIRGLRVTRLREYRAPADGLAAR
jgi:transposase-like protein